MERISKRLLRPPPQAQQASEITLDQEFDPDQNAPHFLPLASSFEDLFQSNIALGAMRTAAPRAAAG
jgi:hypothetical protein